MFHFFVIKSYIPHILQDHTLARAVGIPVGPRSGGRLVMTLMATKKSLFFYLFFPSVATFSHSARIKKLILQKLTGEPQNLGLDTSPDPVSHFGPIVAILDCVCSAA